jgi:hypothetical protein
VTRSPWTPEHRQHDAGAEDAAPIMDTPPASQPRRRGSSAGSSSAGEADRRWRSGKRRVHPSGGRRCPRFRRRVLRPTCGGADGLRRDLIGRQIEGARTEPRRRRPPDAGGWSWSLVTRRSFADSPREQVLDSSLSVGAPAARPVIL